MSQADDLIALTGDHDLSPPPPGKAREFSTRLFGDWDEAIAAAIERARRAEQGASSRKSSASVLVKQKAAATSASKPLITKDHGVARLDHGVFVDQVEKQAEAIQAQKVSITSKSERSTTTTTPRKSSHDDETISITRSEAKGVVMTFSCDAGITNIVIVTLNAGTLRTAIVDDRWSITH